LEVHEGLSDARRGSCLGRGGGGRGHDVADSYVADSYVADSYVADSYVADSYVADSLLYEPGARGAAASSTITVRVSRFRRLAGT
jgi:hypothetical protein